MSLRGHGPPREDRALATTQLRIDPAARSSMWQDLDKRRPTEVDHLHGEIVALAAKHGIVAPINERIVALVHEVEDKVGGRRTCRPRRFGLP